MRTNNSKDNQKMRSGANTANSTYSNAMGQENVVVPQSQPLQARSSNSGTSVKKSDNISQSSYPVGDVSSDKAFHNSGWAAAKTASESTQQMASGQPATVTTGFFSGPSTANTKDGPSITSSKRAANARRANADGQIQSGQTTQVNSANALARGVATRAAGRQTRKGEQQRAVKDSADAQTLQANQGDIMAKPASTVSNNNVNTDNNETEQLLKPTKQSQSEQLGMRQTRSKSKAKQQDQLMTEEPKQEEQNYSVSDFPNGQAIEPAQDGNLDKQANVSINLRPTKRLEEEIGQPWQAEESKLQSPRSLNSTLAMPAGDRAVNQSFRINDSTDSLQENPLTTVIKQFQNLRTNALNAQLTGQNKPTIQQFLEKFEKEMQYIEEQYQAQQQARLEQMRLFEQHYGGKAPAQDNFSSKAGGGARPHPSDGLQLPNDQLSSEHPRQPNTSAKICDAMIVQDSPHMGAIPHDQSNNSFVSAVHGPNMINNSMLGGAASEVTSSEVYESFSFTQNSMLAFYPRQVRKILTRRKTTNSANTIMHELGDLKAPKHKNKVHKAKSKMQSLAVCQMNMMQILLQKISRRSKVIRKQEKIVNDNLKRKRIFLEHPNFNLMKVIRQGLDGSEATAKDHKAGTAGTMQSVPGLAQKNKTRPTAPSERDSRCLSTHEPKYSVDQPQTQSIKGSTAAMPGDNTSMDGIGSKQTRLLSGVENYSMPESVCPQLSPQKIPVANHDNPAARTPEKPSRHGDQRVPLPEEQMNQAVRLSGMDDVTFPKHIGKSQQNTNQMQRSHDEDGHSTQQYHAYADGNQVDPQFEYLQNDGLIQNDKHNSNITSLPMGTSYKQSETPMQQHRLPGLMNQDEDRSDQSNKDYRLNPNGQASRKNQTENQGRSKRKPLDYNQEQPPPQLGLERKLADSSYNTPLAGPTGSTVVTLRIGDQKPAQDQAPGPNPSNNSAQKRQSIDKKTSKPRKRQGGLALKKAHTESAIYLQQQMQQQYIQSEIRDEYSQPQQEDLQNTRFKNQNQLSPFREEVQENIIQTNAPNSSGVNNQNSSQGQHLQHSLSMPPMNPAEFGPLPVEHFANLALIHGPLDMQHDHMMIAAEHERQGIFDPSIKQAMSGADAAAQMVNHAPGSHIQPLLNPGQIADLHMHRSQSVMLPQQMMYFMDPMTNNLAGHAQFEAPFPQDHDFGVQGPPQAPQNTSGRDHNKPQDPVIRLFDDSAQALSSIENSAAPETVDPYGYQTGPNPYERAKREYHKKHMMAQQNNNHQSQAMEQGQMDHLKVQPFDRVNNFVSPIGLQQLSADQHTPQNKQDVQDGQPGPIVDRTCTPSHFMGGDEAAQATTGLGRGAVLAQHTLNADHQQRQQEANQLSVRRLCPDQFNMSANGFHGAERHQDSSAAGHHQALMRAQFGNTPAGLISHTQQYNISDAHRQNLCVSVWNLDVPAAQQDQVNQQRNTDDQIYQDLPEHPYM